MNKDQLIKTLKYDSGWTKTEIISFWGIGIEVGLSFTAYEGQDLTDLQVESYDYFNQNIRNLSNESKDNLIKYLIDNNLTGFATENDINDFVKIKEILFDRDGSIVLLCDCNWDPEHGLGIKIYPDYKFGAQDLFI